MRVQLAHGAAVAALIVTLAGCQSGPGGSGRTWYGAKTKSSAPSYSNAPPGPQLPSAAANPPSGPTQSYASVPPGTPAATADKAAAYPNTTASAQTGPSGTYGATNSAYGAGECCPERSV